MSGKLRTRATETEGERGTGGDTRGVYDGVSARRGDVARVFPPVVYSAATRYYYGGTRTREREREGIGGQERDDVYATITVV